MGLVGGHKGQACMLSKHLAAGAVHDVQLQLCSGLPSNMLGLGLSSPVMMQPGVCLC